MRIGFIGLGIMGRPMSENLLKAGHELVVLDLGRGAVDALVGLGARPAPTPREVADAVEVVITMLPNSPQVVEVALGPGGIVETTNSRVVHVDMSSIAPLAAREVHAGLAARGIAMLDAPVSGGEPKAVDGTLSIMVGGDPAVFARIEPVLRAMGSSVVRVGDVGAGNIAKLANQVVVALNIAAVCEALVLAQKAGVEPEMVVAAIRGGLAGSTVLEAKAPMMLDRNYAPGFRIELHVKDLLNALDTGHVVGAPLPLTASVLEMLSSLRTTGHGGEDHSGLVQFYEQLADTRIARTTG